MTALVDEYWEVSGPRKYLHIPTEVPDHWRAQLSWGSFGCGQSVVAWGRTEEIARAEARRMAESKQKGDV